MKKTLLSALFLVSIVSQAQTIEGIRSAQAVRVNSVEAVSVGGNGFPVTEVRVQATFSNSCRVPRAGELVSIVNYSRNFDDLFISLGSEARRMCPAHFMPVTVTIKVGQFTKPNDGNFSTITVNQVEAN